MNNLQFFVKSFEGFTGSLLEASTLSKTGMPSAMISAIYTKAEHWDKYSRMAHTYRGGQVIPMPYNYHVPSHKIEITEPIKFTGKKTNVDPYSGREIKSFYTDFHWFIESLPLGENRVLIANSDLDFYMYIYHKSKSKGAPGLQYAILWWDKTRKKAIDFGYSELTTRAVDLSQIRGVHDTKGGNRSDKIQEFVRSATREGGGDYAPSTAKPLYAYKLTVDTSGINEPRAIRKTREKEKTQVLSKDFITVFANKYKGLFAISNPKIKDKFVQRVLQSDYHWALINGKIPESVIELADKLKVEPRPLYAFLFKSLRSFRKELYSAGAGAYRKTPGFDLESENLINSNTYAVNYKSFSPDEERRLKQEEENNDQEDQAFREAQPEKYKRRLPVPGEYVSIPSIILHHTLDGALHRYFYYMLTGKIHAPKISIFSIFGIDPNNVDLPDFENWTL